METRLVFMTLPTSSGKELTEIINAKGWADYVLQLWPEVQTCSTYCMLRVPIGVEIS